MHRATNQIDPYGTAMRLKRLCYRIVTEGLQTAQTGNSKLLLRSGKKAFMP